MTDLEMAREIALRVRKAGGTAYFVGGFVRDLLLGRDNKDIDIEIHGITPEMLTGILSSVGELTAFGESFG
ncbi:MAG: tRNA nucleotidyltransferase, partial [Oscillospiraceae bacterium]|nr:tRNA nucleotidyltransferase [Oscillospiraceae bacterium]